MSTSISPVTVQMGPRYTLHIVLYTDVNAECDNLAKVVVGRRRKNCQRSSAEVVHLQQLILVCPPLSSVLGIIKRNFIYMDERTFTLLYKSMVRPHVEYANSVWCPYKIGDSKESHQTSN